MDEFEQEFERFVQKYAELLTGDSSTEVLRKVKLFSLYSHISKTMPDLAKHWMADNPDAKLQIKQIFDELQTLNREHKQKDQS
ncbi:DUF2573 family protein [Bacillus horti]|uniref:DUF2573 family protein n=1 Tax=Caldalkalibacillus horti TaxID=77523 RepID=A0ABT9W2A5_9BACI|nr:DUF2573 family protein [Bacillus horti]MDQ0167371.1 hypothetical protein [Bacillus horti]